MLLASQPGTGSPPSMDDFSPQAHWIEADGVERESWQVFRKEFILSGLISSAMLLITSCFHHEVYFNSQLVDRGPAKSFDFDKLYDAIDVTRWARQGSNALAVLSPRFKQMDVPLSLNPPDSGVLCELIILHADGCVKRISSDGNWKAKKYSPIATGTAWYALLGPEEQFDARLEQPGWKDSVYDDSAWPCAREIGPIGTPPWTAMRKSTMPPQSSDTLYPQRFLAIELASQPKGYNFRLGPASDSITVFMTDVDSEEKTVIHLRFTAHLPVVHVNGRAVDVSGDIILEASSNYVAFCQLAFSAIEPELLVETDAKLTFSSGISGGGQWAKFTMPAVTLAYPWHEKVNNILKGNPQTDALLTAANFAGIPQELKARFMPAIVKQTSAFHSIVTQEYYLPEGGFTDQAISSCQPRLPLALPYVMPLKDRHNLLHDGNGYCTAVPQPGKDVHFVLDFGREIVGHVELTLDAPEGTIVDAQCFELINGGGIAWMNVYNGFRYVCREGGQPFLSHNRRGFRYISITLRNFQRSVAIHKICCLHSAYPVDRIGSFECNDELINKVYQMSIDTAALCMLDSYVDCPGYE